MFNPELEVPDLELCKKLQELGYPQETGGWYYVKILFPRKWVLCLKNPTENLFYSCREGKKYFYRVQDYIKAPTVRELGERLPSSIKWDHTLLCGKMLSGTYFCGVYKKGITFTEVSADKEANARAKMLIWLVENKYIEF